MLAKVRKTHTNSLLIPESQLLSIIISSLAGFGLNKEALKEQLVAFSGDGKNYSINIDKLLAEKMYDREFTVFLFIYIMIRIRFTFQH